jgi:hypothetical protein
MSKTKTGGRQKGTPNKVTSELRTVLQTIVNDEIQHLQTYIDTIPDEQRMQILFRLLPYVAPKPQSTDFDTEKVDPKKLVIVVTNKDV